MDSSTLRRYVFSGLPAPALRLFVLVLACAGFVLSAAPAAAEPPYRSGEVLVKFRDQATGVAIRRALGAREDRVRIAPGLEKVRLKPGETVEEAMAELRTRPGVEHVQPNYIKRIQLTPNDRDFDYQWGLFNDGQVLVNDLTGAAGADVSAPEAWDVTTGSDSVVIAVIDTGIDHTHPDLKDNLWTNPGEVPDNGVDDDGNDYIDDVWGWDSVAGDNRPIDSNGHGTFVTGVLAARGNNGTSVAGVAWRASLMPLRAFDENGTGTTDSIVAAIDYAVDNGADLINASFGAPGGAGPGSSNFDELEYQAIAKARDAGVLVVASACNYGSDNDRANNACVPASYDLSNIIAVAATDPHDELWRHGASDGSNYGSASVDLGAPGVGVITTAPTFRTVWTDDAIYSGSPEPKEGEPGIDLSGQQGCRATVRYGQLASGSGSLKLLAGPTGAELTVLASSNLQSGNFLGQPEVYADLSGLDGEPDVRFEARLMQGTELISGTHIGSVRVVCYGPLPADAPRYYASGTSMAAPFVTGAAALLLSRDPGLGVDALRAAILNNVDQRSGLANLVSTGGRLNIARALGAVGDGGSSTQSANSGASGGGGGGGGSLGWPLLILLTVVLAGSRRYRSPARRLP